MTQARHGQALLGLPGAAKRWQRAGALAVLGLLLPTLAVAEGCPAEGGVEVAALEAMNQKLLDADFETFSTLVAEASADRIKLDMTALATAFPEGFDSCTTVAQRIDPSGMIQHFVVFRSSIGPLFAYWRLIPAADGELGLQSVSLNTELDTTFNDLF